MVNAFRPGVKVVNVKLGGRGRISDHLKSYGWRIPGYLGNGFYQVLDSTGKAWVAHEDDLRLDETSVQS